MLLQRGCLVRCTCHCISAVRVATVMLSFPYVNILTCSTASWHSFKVKVQSNTIWPFVEMCYTLTRNGVMHQQSILTAAPSQSALKIQCVYVHWWLLTPGVRIMQHHMTSIYVCDGIHGHVSACSPCPAHVIVIPHIFSLYCSSHQPSHMWGCIMIALSHALCHYTHLHPYVGRSNACRVKRKRSKKTEASPNCTVKPFFIFQMKIMWPCWSGNDRYLSCHFHW